jgi:hypothetical protein
MNSSAQLSAAVQRVIEQNKSIGYNPVRFISMTKGGFTDDLIEVCEKLLQSDTAYSELWDAIRRIPNLHTLEDEVVSSSDGLGLSAAAIESARDRVIEFNKLRGKRT